MLTPIDMYVCMYAVCTPVRTFQNKLYVCVVVVVFILKFVFEGNHPNRLVECSHEFRLAFERMCVYIYVCVCVSS